MRKSGNNDGEIGRKGVGSWEIKFNNASLAIDVEKIKRGKKYKGRKGGENANDEYCNKN